MVINLEKSDVDNLSKKSEFENVFFFEYSTLDGISGDTTHNSLRLTKSIFVCWTRNLLDNLVSPASLSNILVELNMWTMLL